MMYCCLNLLQDYFSYKCINLAQKRKRLDLSADLVVLISSSFGLHDTYNLQRLFLININKTKYFMQSIASSLHFHCQNVPLKESIGCGPRMDEGESDPHPAASTHLHEQPRATARARLFHTPCGYPPSSHSTTEDVGSKCARYDNKAPHWRDTFDFFIIVIERTQNTS